MEKSEAIKAEEQEFIVGSSLPNANVRRIYSTRGRSSDGLSERERKQLETLDQIPSRKYKKRCLKYLSVAEQRDIKHEHLVKYLSLIHI